MTLHDGLPYAALLFKSPFRNLLALVAVPTIAAAICDRSAALAPRTPAGVAPAAALSAVPGLVGLVVICQAIDIGKVVTWRGVVFHWLTPLVAVGLLAYAVVRAAARQAQVARLFAVAGPARGRLALAAAELDLRARELPSDGASCFVAGALRPTVFVSRGALARLDDAELRAALHHERAHVVGRDTLSLLLLAFLRDFAPWGRGAALSAFRATLEAVADRAAVRGVGRFSLAAALVALARPGGEPASLPVLPMVRADTFRWRMQALLDVDAPQDCSRRDWIRMTAGLALGAGLLAWPMIQFRITELFCFIG
jgi:Zn-dependent protease with chaperone function